jgi:hypothetical protein
MVGGLVSKKNHFLPHSISPVILFRIQSPWSLCLLGISVDASASAWGFLLSVICHLSENHLSCTSFKWLSTLYFQNCMYHNTHPSKYGKTNTNWQLACHIQCYIITSKFDLQLVMKQESQKKDKKSASFMDSHSHFNLLIIGLFDCSFGWICRPCSYLSYYSLQSSLNSVVVK